MSGFLNDSIIGVHRGQGFSVGDKVITKRRCCAAELRVLCVLHRFRENSTRFTTERDTVGMQVFFDKPQAILQTFWRCNHFTDQWQYAEGSLLPVVAFVKVGLLFLRRVQLVVPFPGNSKLFTRRRINDHFVSGTMPDDDGPPRRNSVQVSLCQFPMKIMMETPSQQQLVRVFSLAIGFSKSFQIFIPIPRGRDGSRWQYPIFDRNDFGRHR